MAESRAGPQAASENATPPSTGMPAAIAWSWSAMPTCERGLPKSWPSSALTSSTSTPWALRLAEWSSAKLSSGIQTGKRSRKASAARASTPSAERKRKRLPACSVNATERPRAVSRSWATRKMPVSVRSFCAAIAASTRPRISSTERFWPRSPTERKRIAPGPARGKGETRARALTRAPSGRRPVNS